MGGQNAINSYNLTIFAHYTCKQDNSISSYRKAVLIKELSQSKEDTSMLDTSAFFEAIKLICVMASVNFIRALVEVKYMPELYKEVHYQKLKNSIDRLCNHLKSKIFGQDEQINGAEWLKKSSSSKYDWLWSFKTICDKIFEHAKVKMLHVNE